MNKTLGIDLGTNSIGITLRVDDFFKWYGVYTFKKGVGDGKSGEFSLAADRTKHRSTRRLYNARRYRKWETLKVLIQNEFCPLCIDKLNQWKHYKKGIGRVFPVNEEYFQNWIKLDFDNDGIPDFSSPYQLRRFLINEKLDLTIEENRYKIGRALYHIAQRRGFKSSRKVGSNEKTAVYKGSSETGTIGRNAYEDLIENNGSLGSAFAHLEDKGIRIRNRYTLRSDYLKEVNKILDIQQLNNNFKEAVVKAIFFQRPLRSQKGLVGRCKMETKTVYKDGKKIITGKPRCPISHPNFEEYRAWAFVNNIKYRTNQDESFQPLPYQLKKEIVEEKLLLKANKTSFSNIRKFINKGDRKDWELNYSSKMDKMTVSTSPVSAYFKAAFGEDWRNISIVSNKIKTNRNGKQHKVSYGLEDIWHIAFTFEDEEYFEEFLIKQLMLNQEQVDQLKKLWNALPSGYANLSLKAINNILPFLREGMIYSEAVFLAKIPEIIGKEVFDDNREGIIEALVTKITENRHQKTIINITNSLIADYKILDWEDKFAHKNTSYIITESDENDVYNACVKYFGKNKWDNKKDDFRYSIISQVSKKYQYFFSNSKRDYFKQPKLSEQIQDFLIQEFNVKQDIAEKIYHPSMIDIYPSIENQEFLKSPKTGAFKNPMAYKTLHKLRHVINKLIQESIIDSDTRIVVEIARDLNNKNKRAAIEDYQKNRERENESFSYIISEIIKLSGFSGSANPNSKKDREKFRIWSEQIENFNKVQKEIDSIENDNKIKVKDKDVKKYRLWKEQKSVCLYTGKIIKMTDLFDDNIVDFEHTIPRSISFDNSFANLTVCFADYNRSIKKNKIPTELPNYSELSHGFTAIEPRLKDWKDKVESLYGKIQTQIKNSKNAMDRDAKDKAIRKRHLLQMEYEYWKNKVDRFTRNDIPSGFKNSQLIDTQIISKYAYHYLKTVFNHVETIKGSVTSQFRQVYGIQNKEDKKNRSYHYHHAIDAAVLSLLPTNAKRKDILKRKYEYEESNPKKQYHELPFDGFNYSLIKELENEILINNIKDQDQTLTPTKKHVRKRGKIDYLRNEKGEYIRDIDGNKVPKIAQGDSVRGQLHKDTFYGKIKIAAKDEKGAILRNDDGTIIYEKDKNGNEVYKMVGRKSIENVNFKTDNIIDDCLEKHLKKQIANGAKLNELKDFQGRTIRHLRCEVKSGRGIMKPENATILKEHTYKSAKDYKNYYYTDSGDNYMFGLYENDQGRKIVPFNTLEATKYALEQNEVTKEEIFKTKEPVLVGRGKNKKEAKLVHIFIPGQKVFFFFDSKEELKDLEKHELSKRLYIVKRFHQAERGNIVFQFHLEARNDESLSEKYGTLGKNGFSIDKITESFSPPRILFTPNKNVFVVENKDFEMDLNGKIQWKF